jgi:hypothetical protein
MPMYTDAQWRDALAEAINERNFEKINELGVLASDWLSSDEERSSYVRLIDAVLNLLDEIED